MLSPHPSLRSRRDGAVAQSAYLFEKGCSSTFSEAALESKAMECRGIYLVLFIYSLYSVNVLQKIIEGSRQSVVYVYLLFFLLYIFSLFKETIDDNFDASEYMKFWNPEEPEEKPKKAQKMK
ncbi:hypothetical protein Y032_0122g1041 [Ancylostoma ceylanicum]|uniref:Uncharacterized protein n=1 Tax=Ancylostoma ceylanicum TaxID=53326 RepID=A0A016T8V4_9BILA|nr:hypothetical protein Y032_0122g1041 [Ancylostoma ceylanicum]